MYKNKETFNLIYSQAKTCTLIDFTPPYKKHNLILSLMLSIINLVGAFISSENSLWSWQESLCIGIIIGYAVAFVGVYRVYHIEYTRLHTEKGAVSLRSGKHRKITVSGAYQAAYRFRELRLDRHTRAGGAFRHRRALE